MVLTLPADQGLGFLESCLVEGDPESEKRARRGKQRALVLSIALQIIVVALLVVVLLLGNGERISLKSMTPLPPVSSFRQSSQQSGTHSLSQPAGLHLLCAQPHSTGHGHSRSHNGTAGPRRQPR